MSTFFYNPHISSPRAGVLEIKSPYAVDIHEDDLIDHSADGAYGGLGKRQMVPAVLMRSGSQQSGKRRRLM